MSFREKISWVSLGGILVAFGPYFFAIGVLRQQPTMLAPASAGMFLLALAVLVVVMIAATVLVALTNLRDAQAPSDERDQLIARRGVVFAYPVLLTALFLVLATLFHGVNSVLLINGVLGAIVLAEVTRCTVEIAGYRARG